MSLKENHYSAPATYQAPKGSRLQIWASISAVLAIAVAGYATYWQADSNTRQTLEQIETLIVEGKYEECINQATTLKRDSHFYTEAQALLQQCQLAQAMTLAADSNFKAAIAEATKIPQNSVYHQEAQQLIVYWSDSMLEIAMNNYHSGKLNDAIAIAKAIPETSPVYRQAHEAMRHWHGEWEKNNSHLEAAQIALDKGKWQDAISEARKVAATPYWKQKVEPILQTAESKSVATRQTTRAATRQPARTTRRQPIRTTPRQPTRTTPRQPTRAATRQPTRTTPRQPTRAATRQPTRTAPPKPSSAWKVEIR